jgi:hypothetical protein
MPKTQILNTSINLVIFKPVLVMLCKIVGVPHAVIVAASICILSISVLLIGKVNQRLMLLLVPPAAIMALLATASINQSEYFYNVIFSINVFLILVLFCVQKIREFRNDHLFWRFALIATLLASYIDALFFDTLTNFNGRNTLIGYDNPLWAARDLGVIIFFLHLSSSKNRMIEIGIILATILFFLEARAIFLISLFVCFVRPRPVNLLVGLAILIGIFQYLIQLNPYSVSKRFTEWYQIVSNLHQTPLFGFGVKNYSDISFTNLGAYPHNWVLDVILGYGFLGVFFTVWVGINFLNLLKLKDRKELHQLMAIPIVYILASLSQGSLVSGMLGLCLLPIGYKLNNLLMSRNSQKTEISA